MDKTIQGKSQKDIFFELSGILKLEDYKFKEDTTDRKSTCLNSSHSH